MSSEIRKILHLFWLPGHYFYWARDGTNGKIFVLKLNCMLGSQTQVSHQPSPEMGADTTLDTRLLVRLIVFWWFLSDPLYFEVSNLSLLKLKGKVMVNHEKTHFSVLGFNQYLIGWKSCVSHKRMISLFCVKIQIWYCNFMLTEKGKLNIVILFNFFNQI